jgi:hypothetical protein
MEELGVGGKEDNIGLGNSVGRSGLDASVLR